MSTSNRTDRRTAGEIHRSVLWKGVVAGVAAGLVASFAMDRFQALVTSFSSSNEEDEPATEKAADRAADLTIGRPVPEASKPLAGQGVHYALGVALAAGYGAAAELQPATTAGGGSAFGIAAAALLDNAAVPAAGLGAPPWKTPASTHAYTLASHLVFGCTAELTRRLVRRALG